ncbi:hypothetical protein GGS21DRAFT_509955 [Xylaria nigripes]|nr:hypothetical protein GGS21DRAFT_509955 [Xylaria nigripes]
MGIPFQCLIPLGKGSIFCAAKGSSIHTFDLTASPQQLFSWAHPSSKRTKSSNAVNEAQNDDVNTEQTEQDQPPSKRRKIDPDNAGPDIQAEGEQDAPETPGTGKKNKKKAGANWSAPKQEAPFVVLLTATSDGSHVIAVTGQDKTLWVFGHDGKGALKEISQRAMPKRPCSLALSADGQTILSADKFGDVYALPLIAQEGEQPVSTPTSNSASAQTQPLRGANVFTVHSQRNRRALEDQQRQRKNNPKLDAPKEGPKFAHELLLGHVSMLTCILTVKDSQNRPYIITADRDEHIRVSRGMPQCHVIETYCQGHVSFVSALCNPTPRPDILVSGGGDHELFVWDWLSGKLLSTIDLLSHVHEVLPDATKIAVMKLLAYEVERECYIAAICERVPALFIFLLQGDNTLSHKETLKLHGAALDVAALSTADPTLLITTDPVEGDEEVSIFGHDDENSWAARSSITVTSDTPVLSREDLDKALYTVENLRKTEHEGDEDDANAEEGQPDQAGPS